MILPHVTDFDKVLSGEINQACFKVKPAPDFAGSTPGTQYVYEMRDDIPIMWVEDEREDSIARVVTVWGNTGGWLTGDLAVDPDWYERVKWEQGCEYTVQRGGGKPAVWWRKEDGLIQYAHKTMDYASVVMAVHDAPTTTHWSENRHELPRLRAMGYQPLRIRITGIDCCDVRSFNQTDVKKMGFETFPRFLEPWVLKYDKVARRLIKERHLSWDIAFDALSRRPAPLYDAWKLTFEAVKE